MSSVEVKTEKLARPVAARSRRSWSGIVQWWPARMQIPAAVEDLGHVVGVDPGQVEGHDPTPHVGRRSVQGDPRHLARKHVERVGHELALVGADPVHARARAGSPRRRPGRSPR